VFRTTSRRDRAAEQLRDPAAIIRKKAGPAAEVAREWATPRVGAAKDWASPRLEQARARGVEAAAPRVEAAAEALAPKVDAARDKIVDEVLPRLVEALTAAAAAAAAKTEAAHDVSIARLEDVGGRAKKTGATRGGKGRAFVLLTVLAAAAAAGWAAWKRSQPTDDPWAAGTGAESPAYSSTGSRLSGGDTAEGLGAGTLASESTDVDTPLADGSDLAQADQALSGGSASQALDADGTAEVPGLPTDGDDGSKGDGGRHARG
jgi:hypothetical protein